MDVVDPVTVPTGLSLGSMEIGAEIDPMAVTSAVPYPSMRARAHTNRVWASWVRVASRKGLVRASASIRFTAASAAFTTLFMAVFALATNADAVRHADDNWVQASAVDEANAVTAANCRPAASAPWPCQAVRSFVPFSRTTPDVPVARVAAVVHVSARTASRVSSASGKSMPTTQPGTSGEVYAWITGEAPCRRP